MSLENKKVLLRDICDIRSGYQGTRDDDYGETYQLINLSNLNSMGSIDLNNVKTFLSREVDTQHLLRGGEILLKKSQSSQYVSGVFREGPNNLVPSNHFFILRINKGLEDEIIPEYISWYLGEDVARKHFQSLAAGMVTAIIKKTDLGKLKVSIPPINVQKKLVEIQQLALREKQMMERFILLREKQVKNALINLIGQE